MVCTKVFIAALFVKIPPKIPNACQVQNGDIYMACDYNKIFIVYCNEKGQTLPCSTMNESRRYNIEPKKKRHKRVLTHDTIYIKFKNKK